MDDGFAFVFPVSDTVKYRVIYKHHFVERYELDEEDHPAVKRRIDESVIKQKIEEAIPKIDDIVYGKELRGIIVSSSYRFVMMFHAVETDYGYELGMLNMSNRIDFRTKSAKEVTIHVNPVFAVRFSETHSLALKIGVLADITENWKAIERGVLYHLGGSMMDYWLERSGDSFVVSGADWIGDMAEIEVS